MIGGRGAQIKAVLTADANPLRRELNTVSGRIRRQAADWGKSIRGGMTRAIRGVAAGAGIGIGAGVAYSIGRGIQTGVKANIKKENTQIMLKSLLGSENDAKQAVKKIEEIVKKSPMFSRSGTYDAFTALAPFAEGDLGKLEKLVNLSQRLFMLNPEQGIGGAAFAVKEALSGDYMSLISRFNLSRSEINSLKDQGKSGEEIINTMLERLGIGDNTIADYSKGLSGQWQGLQNQIEAIWMEATASSTSNLKNAMSEFTKILGDNSVALSNLLEGVLSTTANVAGGTAKVASGFSRDAAITGAYLGGLSTGLGHDAALDAAVIEAERWLPGERAQLGTRTKEQALADRAARQSGIAPSNVGTQTHKDLAKARFLDPIFNNLDAQQKKWDEAHAQKWGYLQHTNQNDTSFNWERQTALAQKKAYTDNFARQKKAYTDNFEKQYSNYVGVHTAQINLVNQTNQSIQATASSGGN